MSERPLFGCIEAGGTKFVVGVAHDHETVLRTARILTTTPEETLSSVSAFFAEAAADFGDLKSIGIASFGPLVLDRSLPNWGHIATTPKAGWSDADLVGAFAGAGHGPVGIDTDVNGAILAEAIWGAATGSDVAAYVTVGTGIGGGAIVNGRLVNGLRHPEMGHILVRRHPGDGGFTGMCPFHGDCLEGLASGPAIVARWGALLSELPAAHPGHQVIAYYLAQLVISQFALLSPQKIVIGGGVMNTPGLLNRIRAEVAGLNAQYFGCEDVNALIVAPALGDRAGLLGALALAQGAVR